MAKVNLTGEFTKLTITDGVVQNTSRVIEVEIATEQTKGSGVILAPGERLQFADADNLYARSVQENLGGNYCTIAVEPIVPNANATNIDNIDSNVSDIKSYIADIKTCTTSMTVDVGDIKADVADIKPDVDTINTYVGDIKTLTTGIAADVRFIKGNMLFSVDSDDNIQPNNGGN